MSTKIGSYFWAMHTHVDRPPVTLGDVLAAPDLGLRLLVGPDDAAERMVDGAHTTEVLDPGRWLAPGWVMITTGLQLHRRPDRQRLLVRELAGEGITAVGYCVGVVTSKVPEALIDEARKLDYPVFTVPFNVPARDIITHVSRLLLASPPEDPFGREVAMQDYLINGFDDIVRSSLTPEVRILENLKSLLHTRVEFVNAGSRTALPGLPHIGNLAKTLTGLATQGTTELRLDGDEFLAVPSRLGGLFVGWLLVQLPDPREGGHQALSMAQAAARMIALCVVSRQHSTENQDALRQEILAGLLTLGPGSNGIRTENLAVVSQTRALPLLHTMGFQPGEPVRAVVAQPSSPCSRSYGHLHANLQVSGVPYLHLARDEEFFAVVQADSDTAAALADGFDGVMGVGGPVSSIADIDQSFDQAKFCLGRGTREAGAPVTGPGTQVVQFDTLPLSDWLCEQVSVPGKSAKVEALVEPLRRQPLVLRALIEYLRHDQDIPAAARALHLHPNSLRYRLNKVEAIFGAPLRRPSTIASLFAALTAARIW
ncbi:PucR family transcriptional regulator [Streptomyces sp. NPDC002795]|uniref:PucR family transcriptional regulator n=1 Tax=Streptomyces sp. NPDC002795 TaxID=3364665 RepID=UPI003690E00B